MAWDFIGTDSVDLKLPPKYDLPYAILIIREQEGKAELEETVQFYNDQEYARWNYFVQE